MAVAWLGRGRRGHPDVAFYLHHPRPRVFRPAQTRLPLWLGLSAASRLFHSRPCCAVLCCVVQVFWPAEPHFLRPVEGRYTYANLHALGVQNVLCAWVRPEVRRRCRGGVGATWQACLFRSGCKRSSTPPATPERDLVCCCAAAATPTTH